MFNFLYTAVGGGWRYPPSLYEPHLTPSYTPSYFTTAKGFMPAIICDGPERLEYI